MLVGPSLLPGKGCLCQPGSSVTHRRGFNQGWGRLGALVMLGISRSLFLHQTCNRFPKAIPPCHPINPVGFSVSGRAWMCGWI